MKKIKLLTGLGVVSALGVGAVATTSCTWSYKEGDEPIPGNTVYNGVEEFSGKAELKAYADASHWLVKDMPNVTVKSDGSDAKAKLLDPYVKAGHIADGLARCYASGMPEEAQIILFWSTSETEIIVSMTVISEDPDTGEVSEYIDQYTFTKTDSSYYDHVLNETTGGQPWEGVQINNVERELYDNDVIQIDYERSNIVNNGPAAISFYISDKDFSGTITIN